MIIQGAFSKVAKTAVVGIATEFCTASSVLTQPSRTSLSAYICDGTGVEADRGAAGADLDVDARCTRRWAYSGPRTTLASASMVGSGPSSLG